MKRSGSGASGIVHVAIVGFALSLAWNASAQPVDYAGHKLVRVEVKNAQDLQILEGLGGHILNCLIGVGPLDASVPPDKLAELDKAGLAYIVLDDDIGPETSRHLLPPPRGLGPFDDYIPFDQIVAFINSLAAARPDLCEVIDIGNSLEGRDIWVLHITGPGAGPKPAVFYHGLQHVREWITGPVVMYLADHLVNNYDTDPCVADLVDRLDIYLAPCVNPDGYVYTWGPDRLWRKNRRNNGGSFGVDLNRNWGYQWGYSDSGSSSAGSSEVYRGTAAFSEPETQVLRDFILSHPEIRVYMDYHSYSELILWPWGYDCLNVTEPDASTFDALGTEVQRLIADVHGHTYTAGPICQTLYDANGCSVDWVYGTAGRFGLTIELRPTGSPGFELPPDQILPTCEENLPGILHLTRAAADGVAISFPNGAPTQTGAGQPTAVTIDIAEPYDTYVPGSGALHYRFAPTAPYSLVPLNPAGGGFTASIPSAPCDAAIEYYVTVQTAGGGTVTAPCNAPAQVFTAAVVDFTVAFADSFQTDLGWTTEVLGASSGAWQRGVPVNDPSWAYDPASDSDGSGSCFLTQNANGNTDVDGGAVRLTSPTLNMSAGNLGISYDYYLYLTVTAGDGLLVEFNSNDGTGAWTQIANHQTDGGLSWRHQEISAADLAAAGVTQTSTVKVRFTATDGGTASIVEAGVDAFTLASAGCDAVPGDADGDGDADLADFAYFVDCLGGPGAPVPPTCQAPHAVFDFDGDADIDLEDFEDFQGAVTP